MFIHFVLMPCSTFSLRGSDSTAAQCYIPVSAATRMLHLSSLFPVGDTHTPLKVSAAALRQDVATQWMVVVPALVPARMRKP